MIKPPMPPDGLAIDKPILPSNPFKIFHDWWSSRTSGVFHERLYKQKKFFLGAKALFKSSPKDCGLVHVVEETPDKKGL
jgi:hypothetical protein